MLSSLKRIAPNGFTIIELLIAIVVIGVLASVTLISYNGIQAKARDNALRSDLESIVSGMTRYSVNHEGAFGPELAWYWNGGTSATLNTHIGFRPSPGNVIDVVADSTRYCVRGYNVGSSFKTIDNAVTRESEPGACAALAPSTAAVSDSAANPTFRAAQGGNSGASNSDRLTLSVPSGVQNGDVMIANVEMINGSVAAGFLPTAGWTILDTQVVSSPNRLAQALYWRVANSEPATYDFVTTGAASCCKIAGVIVAYSNVNTSFPFAGSSKNAVTTQGTSGEFSAVTATSKGRVIAFGGGRGASASLGTPTMSAYTIRQSANTTASSWMNAFVAEGPSIAGGETVTPPPALYTGSASTLLLMSVVLRGAN